MSEDPYDLERFVTAQERDYSTALAELTNGKKRSHWIWYVFPQMRDLGFSQLSQHYGISGMAEAQAYLAHPLLGPRMTECVTAILRHRGTSAKDILGGIDATKFRSSMTLFALAAPTATCFHEALEQFFQGQLDAATIGLLQT